MAPFILFITIIKRGVMKKLWFVGLLSAVVSFSFGLPRDRESITSYLEYQAKLEGVPQGLVLGIMGQETGHYEDFDRACTVVSGNIDGSYDKGLFQLNSRYIAEFVDRFWHRFYAFDYADPYDNGYIAVRHIAWLYGKAKKLWENDVDRAYIVAVAYNCGWTRTILGEVPVSSQRYAMNVLRSMGY
jgi:hypothetical protein